MKLSTTKTRADKEVLDSGKVWVQEGDVIRVQGGSALSDTSIDKRLCVRWIWRNVSDTDS